MSWGSGVSVHLAFVCPVCSGWHPCIWRCGACADNVNTDYNECTLACMILQCPLQENAFTPPYSRLGLHLNPLHVCSESDIKYGVKLVNMPEQIAAQCCHIDGIHLVHTLFEMIRQIITSEGSESFKPLFCWLFSSPWWGIRLRPYLLELLLLP